MALRKRENDQLYNFSICKLTSNYKVIGIPITLWPFMKQTILPNIAKKNESLYHLYKKNTLLKPHKSKNKNEQQQNQC